MKLIRQKGFSTIGVLLISVVIIAISAGGVLVYRHSQNTANDMAAQKGETTSAIAVNEAKLPTGWKVGNRDSGSVTIDSADRSCYVQALYTSDTAESNSPDIDHWAQTLEAITSKGFTREDRPNETLSLATNTGSKPVVMHVIRIGYPEQSSYMTQYYAFLSTKEYYSSITLSCNQDNQIPDAKTALAAVSFDKL